MHLVAEETAGDVDLLAPDDDNLLAIKDLLRDNRSKPAQKMALAVNDDGGGGEGGHGESECVLRNAIPMGSKGEFERDEHGNAPRDGEGYR